MCEISSITEINNNIVLGCTEYDGSFENASTLKIFDINEVFETQDFKIDKSRACFTTKITPWIMLDSKIPSKFLKTGNRIELL